MPDVSDQHEPAPRSTRGRRLPRPPAGGCWPAPRRPPRSSRGLARRRARDAAVAAATPTCAMSGLVAWIDTQGNGAAGSVSYNLGLTNLSGRTCTLSGYPRVAGVDLDGRQLGSGSGRERSSTPQVTLRNLATALDPARDRRRVQLLSRLLRAGHRGGPAPVHARIRTPRR